MRRRREKAREGERRREKAREDYEVVRAIRGDLAHEGGAHAVAVDEGAEERREACREQVGLRHHL